MSEESPPEENPRPQDKLENPKPENKTENPKQILPSKRPAASTRQDKKDWEPTKPSDDKQ